MTNDFSDEAQHLIHFLKAEYLEKGEAPRYAESPGTFHRDVMGKFNWTIAQYREFVAELQSRGLVEPIELMIPNGYLKIRPEIVAVARSLDVQRSREGKSMEGRGSEKRVFIGHGWSKVWIELKRFLEERLHLPSDEFNRESTAGKSTKDILKEKLNNSCFAFLIMTGDDEHADGSTHARENVIHEIGLFQGRLGFEKAIILLEGGCAEFSNVEGLTQIRFSKGAIASSIEEIRRVLERERILTVAKRDLTST